METEQMRSQDLDDRLDQHSENSKLPQLAKESDFVRKSYSFQPPLAEGRKKKKSLSKEPPGVTARYSICRICDRVNNDLVSLASCEHKFCRVCLGDYISYRVLEALVSKMPCPDHLCDFEITEAEIKDLIPDNTFAKYLKFKHTEELDNNPFLRWCPQPDCSGFDIGNLTKHQLICSVCRHNYCYYCSGPWHTNDKCKMKNDKELDKWLQKRGARFCPNCRIRVEKSIGCDHMTCYKCKYEWCWLCGEKFSSGHSTNCEVLKKRKWDKPLSYIFLMIFSLIILAVFPLFIILILVYETDMGLHSEAEFLFRCLKKRLFVYIVSILIGILLIPFYYSLGPVIIGIIFMYKFLRELIRSKLFRVILSPFLGTLISPLVIICSLVVVVFFTIFGLALLFLKAFLALRRCLNPKYKVTNAKYNPIS